MGKVLVGIILGLLVVPVIGAVIAFSGHFPIQATAKPPGWERQLANMALDPAVDRETKGLTDPTAGTDADLMKGMKIYRDNCAICHGVPGKPSLWAKNNFYPPAPQLYERGVHDPVPNIFAVVKFGVRYTGMGGWKDALPDDDLWRVSGFLHRVKTLPPAVASAWRDSTKTGASAPEPGGDND